MLFLLHNLRDWNCFFFYYTYKKPTISGRKGRLSSDPEKYFTQNWKKSNYCLYCRVCSGKFVTLLFDNCWPSSPLIPHSITSPYTPSPWHPFIAGSTSVPRLFNLIVFPTKCKQPCSLSSTEHYTWHIAFLWIAPHTYSLFFLCFLNVSLYLLTEPQYTYWYISPP